MNKISNKQQEWANDIKMRIRILKAGFEEKCPNLKDEEIQKVLRKVDIILECEKIYYIIDEYKSISDEFIVKMFDLTDKKYCNMFINIFNNTGMLYQIQQKTRLEQQKKLKAIFRKYSKSIQA